jgi:O-antigen ligase
LILLLSVNLVTSARHLKWLFHTLFVESALVGAVAAGQFVRQYRAERLLHPGQVYIYMRASRVHGLMGHWMNFGGQQMLIFAALCAFLLFSPRARKVWWLIGAMVAASIVLNFTRGVWVGCFVAIVYLIARWRARWLWILPVLLLAGFFAAPSLIRKRLESVRHPWSDPSIAIRFEMWQVGFRMMERHPLVGVGPDNITETYTLYLPPGKTPMVGYREHLHNNFIQFGAERGLPCLAAWVWLMAAFAGHFVRMRRQFIRVPSTAGHAWLVDAALAGWLAFVIEGCFEFNFGTSPVLMVFLFMMSVPFAAEMRLKKKESGDRSQESE